MYGYRHNSTIRNTGKAPARRNEKRAERNFRRAFHSDERILFVRSLACVVTGKRPCDNAHIPGARGAGASRRGDFDQIVPLLASAHRLLHDDPKAFYERYGEQDWQALAEKTQAGWLAYSGAAEPGDDA